MLSENLKLVRERIARAADAAGRDPSEVTLVCVSKGIPPERIREALACGVREIGENRVQEAAEKQLALGTVPAGPARRFCGGDCPQITWHLVGHLQRNKAKWAVQLFDVIHSVDSLELIEALEQQMTPPPPAVKQMFHARQSSMADSPPQIMADAGGGGVTQRRPGRMLETLLQVNVSGEATKHGCRPDQAAALAEALLRARHLKFAGLMTMAPYTDDPEDARPVFRQLRELRDHWVKIGTVPFSPRGSLPGKGDSPWHLSMGMSHDFEVAVQEGATIVRIGTAIFGETLCAIRWG